LITAGTKSEFDAGSSIDGPAPAATTWRIDSVDLLRGVVMAFMLLDHTREFVHRDVLNFDATDLSRTNVLLFFTRWITHFCAPVFVFLAGTGAFLQMARGKSKPELSRFLVKRGLWFISPLDRPSPNPGNLGFSLWVVYVFWFLGLLLLYPLCRWFAEVKRRRRDWWLSYL
jgi:hypothetical protein